MLTSDYSCTVFKVFEVSFHHLTAVIHLPAQFRQDKNQPLKTANNLPLFTHHRKGQEPKYRCGGQLRHPQGHTQFVQTVFP